MFPLVAVLFLVAADRSAGFDVGRDVGVLEVVTNEAGYVRGHRLSCILRQ